MRRIVYVVPLVTALLTLAVLARGETPSLRSPSGSIEPEITGIGARLSVGDERFIAIHHQSRNQTSGPIVHYFHKPLFIFETNGHIIDGYPDIVAAAPRVIGNKTFLFFRIILTTHQFQEYARAFVIANDPELKSPGQHIDLNSIVVDGWPIVNLNIKVVEPLTGSVLANWTSPSLEAAGSTISVPLGFDSRGLETFKSLAPLGEVEFYYSYTFRNSRVQFASSVTNASRKLTQILQNTIGSLNISPDRPIFQDQANAFRSKIATQVTTEIVASQTDLVPLVNSQLVDHYMTQQVIALDSITDQKTADAISAYLKPLLQTMEEKHAEEQKNTKTNEDVVTIDFKGEKKAGSMDLGFVKPGGIGGSFDISKTDKDALTTEHGVTFEQSKTNQTFKPHDIKVFRISTISDDDTVDVVSRAFISQGGDPSFQDDTPVASNFTDKRVGSFKSGEKIAAFDAVLPGMAFCFFGREVPRGYAALDGRSRWPDAAWVPDHLRGKPLPDGQDMIVGISNHGNDVGTVWHGGKIAMGAFSIPAKGLMPTWGPRGDGRLVIGELSDLSEHANPRAIGIGDFAIWPANISSETDNPSIKLRVQSETATTGIEGNLAVTPPIVKLEDSSTNPRNLRCKLIVKQ